MNTTHFPSHSNRRQLQPFEKASYHLFITCYLTPTAHAKIQLFLAYSSSCLQHNVVAYKKIFNFWPLPTWAHNHPLPQALKVLHINISYLFLHVFDIHFLYSYIVRINLASSFRITFINYACFFKFFLLLSCGLTTVKACTYNITHHPPVHSSISQWQRKFNYLSIFILIVDSFTLYQ